MRAPWKWLLLLALACGLGSVAMAQFKTGHRPNFSSGAGAGFSTKSKPGGGGATFLADTFDRANAATLGANWTDETNGFAIAGNSATGEVDNFAKNLSVHVTPLAGLNQFVRINVNITGISFPGMAFRYVDSASGHYLVDFSTTQLWWSYYPSAVAPVDRNIINGAGITFVSGNSLGITIKGTGAATRLRVWFDTLNSTPDAGGETWDSLSPDINQLIDVGLSADTGTKVGVCHFFNPPSGAADIAYWEAGTF